MLRALTTTLLLTAMLCPLACLQTEPSLRVLRTRGGETSEGCRELLVQAGDELRVVVSGPAEKTGQVLLRPGDEPTQFLAGVLFDGGPQTVPPTSFSPPDEASRTVIVLVIDEEEVARCTVQRKTEEGAPS